MQKLSEALPRLLHTPRLTLELQNYSDEHWNVILTTNATPTARRNIGDNGVRNKEQLSKRFQGVRLKASQWPGGTDGDCDIAYLIHLGDEKGPYVGFVCALSRPSDVPCDVGWALLEDHMKQGYATEAASELVRFLTEELGMTELMAYPGDSNRPSQRVCEKIGFVRGPRIVDEAGNQYTVWLRPGTKSWEDGRLVKRAATEESSGG